MRCRGFDVGFIFIFIDPSAGRHSLFLLRQKKVSKKRRFTPPTLSVHLQRDNGVVRKAPFPGYLQRRLKPIAAAPNLCGLRHQDSSSGRFWFGRVSGSGEFSRQSRPLLAADFSRVRSLQKLRTLQINNQSSVFGLFRALMARPARTACRSDWCPATRRGWQGKEPFGPLRCHAVDGHLGLAV